MAIVHFAYLFNPTEFQNEISPIIPKLDMGNYHALYQKAIQVAQQKPNIWDILQNHFYGTADLLEENTDFKEPPTGFWFLVILAKFLEPIPSYDLSPSWVDQCLRIDLIRYGLEIIGWEKQDCELLIFGMNTNTLILPSRFKKMVKSYKDFRKGDCCYIPGGWLDMTNITSLLTQLEKDQDNYLKIGSQLKLFTEKSGWDITHYDKERMSQLLISSYNDAELFLSTAQKTGKSLYMQRS